MDSDTEFPMPSYREREAITRYLEIEHEFIAATDFYTTASNLQYRRHAVSTIARLWHAEVLDVYIPYLAMNYFDRFASTNPLTDLQGPSSITETVRLVAICCLTLSYKMRTKEFILHQFLKDKKVNFKPDRIMRMEYRILSGLDWRMRSITPFYFLDHYYPIFKRIGGFKRRCINEIIVQSQGEYFFTQYKPSQIAMSAFLGASYIAYPTKFNSIDKSEELMGCWRELVNLCLKRDIELRTESGTVVSSGKLGATLSTPSEEAAAAETQTTKSEEELAEAVELQLQKHSSSKTTQFWNTVLDKEEEEEEEDVAPLTRRRRRDRGQVVIVETGEEVAAAETEAKQQGQDQGEAVTVADTTEEKEVEAETGGKEDKGEGVVKASEEIVAGETEVNPQGQASGKAVEEICEEEAQIERNRRLRWAKGKAQVGEEEEGKPTFVSELIPAAEAAPKKLMNFDLKWPITVEPGEIITYVDESLQIDESRWVSVQCPQTIRGTGHDPPLNTNCCSNCCTTM